MVNTRPNFRQVRTFLGRTTGSAFVARAHADIARAVVKVADAGFARGKDPYGRAWPKPLAGGRPLVKTGALRQSLRPSASARGARVITTLKYAGVHNRGAVIRAKRSRYLKFRVRGQFVQKRQVKIPKRTFLLERGQPLSASYRRAITAVLDKRVQRAAR